MSKFFYYYVFTHFGGHKQWGSGKVNKEITTIDDGTETI